MSEENVKREPIPRLQTERLILRPFCLYDAKLYRELCSSPEVLSGTDMPHSFDPGAIEEWIISHPERWNQRYELFLLITNKVNRAIIGSLSLFLYMRHNKADIGYLISPKEWGKGYATEACSVVVRYAFEIIKLHKLEANHLARNPASGRVLEKLGFQLEGLQRESYFKDGVHEDLRLYGLLQREFLELQQKRKQTSS